METVQLALTNVSYAKALRLLLGRNGTCQVVCVEVPDLQKSGVIVVDGTAVPWRSQAAIRRHPSQEFQNGN